MIVGVFHCLMLCVSLFKLSMLNNVCDPSNGFMFCDFSVNQFVV